MTLREQVHSDYARLEQGFRTLPHKVTSAEVLVPLLEELLRQAKATALIEGELPPNEA